MGQFRFHYDIPDFKSIAVFIYLCDVDINAGPHVHIKGTHKGKGLWAIVSNVLSKAKAHKKYKDKINIIIGQKGTVIIEDIYSYHKALNPVDKPRLVLKFFYGVQRKTRIHNTNLKEFS